MDPNLITYFGETDAKNRKIKFGIKAKDRLKHVYIIGKTGMGKSTLLENLAIQDIQNGNGLAFIDPHGGTAEKLLEYVPEDRIKDVLYFAPFDMEYPISFNVMEDVGRDKRHLVVNGLMSTFEKIWADAWSARMSYILQYAIIALLEYPGSTLLGINKMLSDKEYRKKVIDNLTDASARSFWIDEFGKYTERFAAEATPAIQNKVGQFTSNPLVRNIIGQSHSSFDVRKIMDEKKIMIVNLSKGRVGEGNANLIGSMLITKIYLSAMSRADLSEGEIAKLPPFFLYVDEFQSFANKSFADILSEARKYKLGLTIAHQYIEQMEEEVRNAVFGNVGTMIAFRVGAFDAEVLEKEFSPTFTAEDLVNLGFTQIYLKLMIDGVSSAPFSSTTIAPIKRADITFKDDVIESSRLIYAKKRVDVEEEINKFYQAEKSETPALNKMQSGQSSFRDGERKQNSYNNYNNQNQRNHKDTQNFEIKKENEKSSLSSVLNNVVKEASPQKPEIKKEITREDDLFNTPQTKNDVSKESLGENFDKNKQAFLNAKIELEKIEKEKNEINFNKKEDLNFSQKIEQKSDSSMLKIEHENKKIPTNENINGLKNALSSVLNKPKVSDVQIEVSKDISEENSLVKKNQIEQDKKTNEFKKDVLENRVKEVPEDVLRKLLSMDE